MTLTEERKKYIDSLGHGALLSRWRFAPVGDPWFQGETGDYWVERLSKSVNENPGRHTSESKSIGWSE